MRAHKNVLIHAALQIWHFIFIVTVCLAVSAFALILIVVEPFAIVYRAALTQGGGE